MANTTSQSIVFIYCLLLFILFFSLRSSSSHDQIPALYIFGDSTVDAGNNNHLDNTSKANHLPFGIDFNNSNPTGRFTNGKTIADLLAMKLGLPLVAAYLDLSEDQRKHTTTGINYASGGCGILPSTNYKGNCLSLDMQIDYFAKTVSEDLPNTIQNPQELQFYLSNSIFLISIGTNDYGLNYLDLGNPNSLGKSLTQEEFANLLLEQLSSRLKRLIDLGAKKFLINNLGPLGCIPLYTYDTGNCVDPINKMVKLYSDGLPGMLSHLIQGDLKAPTFSFSDNFRFFQEMKASGVLDTKHKCAINGTTVCKNRDKFFFFDGIHTSQVANSEFVDGCFYKSLCTPNIEQLIVENKE